MKTPPPNAPLQPTAQLRQARLVQPQERIRDLKEWVPKELRSLEYPQSAIPAIAKDSRLLNLIDNAVRSGALPAHRL